MKHQLSVVHPDSKVADSVEIGPFTVIEEDVEIGEGTWIGSNVVINSGARIGKNCKIYPGAVISGMPQDLKFEGEKTLTIIGDNTTIREFVTISRGTKDKWETRVGSNCLVMAYVHIAHDCLVGDYCILVNNVQLAGHVTVNDHAVIGGSSAVHQFARIGSHAMISGGSLVRKDVPPFTKAGREPLGYVGINSIGLRRRGFSNEKIREIQEIYRYIYLKGLNNSKALDLVESELPASTERDEIVTFIRSSERGVMRGFNQ